MSISVARERVKLALESFQEERKSYKQAMKKMHWWKESHVEKVKTLFKSLEEKERELSQASKELEGISKKYTKVDHTSGDWIDDLHNQVHHELCDKGTGVKHLVFLNNHHYFITKSYNLITGKKPSRVQEYIEKQKAETPTSSSQPLYDEEEQKILDEYRKKSASSNNNNIVDCVESTTTTTTISNNNNTTENTGIATAEPTSSNTLGICEKDLATFKTVANLCVGEARDRLKEAGQMLQNLKDKLLFRMTNPNEASEVGDRPPFHVYNIIKNEEPSLLRNDLAFGNKVMSGEYEASNAHRRRAIQRAQVEVALEEYRTALKLEDQNAITKALQNLEAITLDQADGIPTSDGIKTNIAHYLFGVCYGQFLTARQTDKSVKDLTGIWDSGRHAAHLSSSNLTAIQLQAVDQVLAHLKTAWKIN